MRKLLPQFLKPEALQRYTGIMDHIAQRHFADSWDNRDEVIVFPLAKRFTFWLACRLFMSIEDPAHVAKFEKPFHVLASGLITIPIDLPGTPFHRAIKASNFIRKELRAIIKQRKIDLAESKASKTQDILSHMLLATDEDGCHMNEMSIADKILGLLIGGHDTASSAITFLVKYMAELPHIYEKVYKGKSLLRTCHIFSLDIILFNVLFFFKISLFLLSFLKKKQSRLQKKEKRKIKGHEANPHAIFFSCI